MTRQQAVSMVAKAVREGRLPRVNTQVCVDCGKQAQAYDHRRYSAPLDVVPVCTPCNFKRGPAQDAGPSTTIPVRLKLEQRIALERMAAEEGRSLSSCLRGIGSLLAQLPLDERRNFWDAMVAAVHKHEAHATEAAA